jgi:dTDP-4-amino-4,6-dideoxygalactose transaminase
MNIAFVDLKAQQARIVESLDARLKKVLAGGQYILGPEVAELEGVLAAFAGARHCVAVSNGTDALRIVLMAWGVGPGDAVFLPAFTYTATAEVVLLSGAEPIYVDVDEADYNLDLADLQRRVAAVRQAGRFRPRAIIAVDLFGQPADYAALNRYAQAEGLLVLADGAQSYGAARGGARVGTLASVTATSFFPSKPLGCYGDGGAILTDDEALASAYRSIRAHGQGRDKYEIVRLGMNARLDSLQAAVLLAKMEIFPDEIERRNRVAERYSERLANHVVTPGLAPGVVSVWAQYTIRVNDRDGVQQRLKANGVPTQVYYPKPMHLQEAYRRADCVEGALPVSERLAKHVLALPMHPYLQEAEIDYIADAVVAAVRG